MPETPASQRTFGPRLSYGRQLGQQSNARSFVSTVSPVPVDVGVATRNLIQVKGAIKPAQLVVVEGNERLRPGQEVVVKRVVEPEPAAVGGTE